MFQIIVGYFEHDVSLIFQLNSPQEINDKCKIFAFCLLPTAHRVQSIFN